MPLLIAAFGAAALAAAAWCSWKASSTQSKRVLVAVSGTIQDGFELRPNIDYGPAKAVFIGWAVCRGAKMYFDIKDVGSREYDPKVPHRVNPAMVLTGDSHDANQYALFLVDERAVLRALLGEPRLLSMAPDALRISLDDPGTSPSVARLSRTIARHRGVPPLAANALSEVAILAVISVRQGLRFVEAPAIEERSDGTRLTSFVGSLARFAGIDTDSIRPASPEWNAAVAAALQKADVSLSKSSGDSWFSFGSSRAPGIDDIYATSSEQHSIRLSAVPLSVNEFNRYAREAQLGIVAC
mmetsp:Transcript_60497/g.112318  ORF Transcript_60497/g.112318 Transcript_60497/m.112318 type:complete len:298 (+) Transcript_60497:63-956(+)